MSFPSPCSDGPNSQSCLAMVLAGTCANLWLLGVHTCYAVLPVTSNIVFRHLIFELKEYKEESIEISSKLVIPITLILDDSANT